MTCRDCLIHDICKEKEKLMLTVDNLYELIYQEAVEVSCRHFKNKADVVEVVRCKECKHCELRYPAKAIGEEAIEGYYCYPNQRYVKSTDFCNYGERRDI